MLNKVGNFIRNIKGKIEKQQDTKELKKVLKRIKDFIKNYASYEDKLFTNPKFIENLLNDFYKLKDSDFSGKNEQEFKHYFRMSIDLIHIFEDYQNSDKTKIETKNELRRMCVKNDSNKHKQSQEDTSSTNDFYSGKLNVPQVKSEIEKEIDTFIFKLHYSKYANTEILNQHINKIKTLKNLLSENENQIFKVNYYNELLINLEKFAVEFQESIKGTSSTEPEKCPSISLEQICTNHINKKDNYTYDELIYLHKEVADQTFSEIQQQMPLNIQKTEKYLEDLTVLSEINFAHTLTNKESTHYKNQISAIYESLSKHKRFLESDIKINKIEEATLKYYDKNTKEINVDQLLIEENISLSDYEELLNYIQQLKQGKNDNVIEIKNICARQEYINKPVENMSKEEILPEYNTTKPTQGYKKTLMNPAITY